MCIHIYLSYCIYFIFNIVHPIVCSYLLFLNININLNDYSIFPKFMIFIFYYIYFPIINIAIYIKYIMNKEKNITSDINLGFFRIPMTSIYLKYYLFVYPIIALIINILEYIIGIILNNTSLLSYNFVIGNYIFYSLITILLFMFITFLIYIKLKRSCNSIHVVNENDPLLDSNP